MAGVDIEERDRLIGMAGPLQIDTRRTQVLGGPADVWGDEIGAEDLDAVDLGLAINIDGPIDGLAIDARPAKTKAPDTPPPIGPSEPPKP